MQCKCGVLTSWWLDKSTRCYRDCLTGPMNSCCLIQFPYLEGGGERVEVGWGQTDKLVSAVKHGRVWQLYNNQPQSVDINAVVEAKVNFSVLRWTLRTNCWTLRAATIPWRGTTFTSRLSGKMIILRFKIANVMRPFSGPLCHPRPLRN